MLKYKTAIPATTICNKKYTYTYTHVYTHHTCIMHTYYVYSMHIAYVYIKNYILIIVFLAKVKFELKLN